MNTQASGEAGQICSIGLRIEDPGNQREHRGACGGVPRLVDQKERLTLGKAGATTIVRGWRVTHAFDF